MANECMPKDERWLSFFNTKDFFKYHATNEKDSIIQLTDKNDKVLARTCIYWKSDKEVISPKSATYGGPDLLPGLPSKACETYIKFFCSALTSLGANKISLTLPPLGICHTSYQYLPSIFFENGFEISSTDISHHICVTSADFSTRTNRATKRKIARLANDGHSFKEVKIDDLEKIYSIIEKNRRSKGYKMSLTYTSLVDQVENFREIQPFYLIGCKTT